MNTTPSAPTLTADDIPEVFTLDGLKQYFSDEEIAAMNEGDDPIIPEGEGRSAAPPANPDDPDLDDLDEVAQAPSAPAPAAEAEQDPPPPVNLKFFEDKVAALDAQIEDLQAQYDDGDLTSAEWRKALNETIEAKAQAQIALNQAASAPATPIEDYQAVWFGKVEAYRAQHPYLHEPEHFGAWDAALKMVNTNGAYQQMTMSQKIEQAHRIYAAHYEGLEGKALPTNPGLSTAQKKAAAVPGPRTDPRPDAPLTLATLTNASDGELEDGRFAQIDRISDQDPIKGEKLFSAMSEADQIAYLNGI